MSETETMMAVSVAFVDTERSAWLRLSAPTGITVEQAIQKSGILERFPDIDLAERKVGVFGKPVSLKAELQQGDRVEIYTRALCSADEDDDEDDD